MTSDVVDPIKAYEGAPPIVQEISWTADRAMSRPFLAEWGREFQLRKAALLDRIALREAAEYPLCTEMIARATECAEEAAQQLVELDNTENEQRGSRGPEQGLRHYVRQEYDAWRRSDECA